MTPTESINACRQAATRHLRDFCTAPSAARHLNRIADELIEGRSLCLFTPQGTPGEPLSNSIGLRLNDRGRQWRIVNLPELETIGQASPLLGEALGLPKRGATTPEGLAAHLDPWDCIVGEGFDLLTPDSRKTWGEFFTQWSRLAHQRSGEGRKTSPFCLVCGLGAWQEAGLDVPRSEVFQVVHWWWNVLAPLDLEVLLRQAHDEIELQGAEDHAYRRWQETVVPSLSVSDPELAAFLLQNPESPDGLAPLLAEWARERRGWTAEELCRCGASQWADRSITRQPQSAPPETARSLWAMGALVASFDYGIELHSGALALLNRVEQVERRLWRAQVSVLFPVIEELRLWLCERIEEQAIPG